MKTEVKLNIVLVLSMTALMSLPFLVKGCGWMSLIGLVPLLLMERLAARRGAKHFFWWHYLAFLLWNGVTVWWIAGATVGGAVFAIIANALQMALIFEAFRIVKRRTGGVLPYIFLVAAWIAWERYYLTIGQIAFPWLILGNSFLDTTELVQWYEYTGALGGSLWVWCVNLAVFGLGVSVAEGRFPRLRPQAKAAAISAALIVLAGPMVCSAIIGSRYEETDDPVTVVIPQPNFDPYHKFESLTQSQQTDSLVDIIMPHLAQLKDEPVLVLTPETFTNDVITNRIMDSRTVSRLVDSLKAYPNVNLVLGASAHDEILQLESPHILAYRHGFRTVDGVTFPVWYQSRNSALMLDSAGCTGIYHKSMLVLGTELTPYPKVFVPLENLLGGNLMGKCIGQEEPSNLHFSASGREFDLAPVICYESIYGEYGAKYVRKGAKMIAVITNDAWWGDTPGYRQHVNLARLMAIQTRRDIARCANTGVSAFINQKGEITRRTPYWKRDSLRGTVNLSGRETFFVRYGDITGRVSVFVFILCLLAAIVRPSPRLRFRR